MLAPATKPMVGPLLRLIAATAATLVIAACGGSDDDDDPGARVAAACSGTCQDLAVSCGAAQPAADACQGTCEVAGTLSLACASGFEAYVACAGERPAVSCDGASVTISAAALDCIEPLTAYLLCAAEGVATACVRTPTEDAQCQTRGIGSQASVCAAAPPGCALFEGTLRADGVGVFCCP